MKNMKRDEEYEKHKNYNIRAIASVGIGIPSDRCT